MRRRPCYYCKRGHVAIETRQACETAALTKLIRYFEAELDRVQLHFAVNKRKTETIQAQIQRLKIGECL